jgi:uncharacterized protein DUF1348
MPRFCNCNGLFASPRRSSDNLGSEFGDKCRDSTQVKIARAMSAGPADVAKTARIGNRIAVRFAYEWHDDSRNWFRSCGNENWEFDENSLVRLRFASINDLSIKETERKYQWGTRAPYG